MTNYSCKCLLTSIINIFNVDAEVRFLIEQQEDKEIARLLGN